MKRLIKHSNNPYDTQEAVSILSSAISFGKIIGDYEFQSCLDSNPDCRYFGLAYKAFPITSEDLDEIFSQLDVNSKNLVPDSNNEGYFLYTPSKNEIKRAMKKFVKENDDRESAGRFRSFSKSTNGVYSYINGTGSQIGAVSPFEYSIVLIQNVNGLDLALLKNKYSEEIKGTDGENAAYDLYEEVVANFNINSAKVFDEGIVNKNLTLVYDSEGNFQEVEVS